MSTKLWIGTIMFYVIAQVLCGIVDGSAMITDSSDLSGLASSSITSSQDTTGTPATYVTMTGSFFSSLGKIVFFDYTIFRNPDGTANDFVIIRYLLIAIGIVILIESAIMKFKSQSRLALQVFFVFILLFGAIATFIPQPVQATAGWYNAAWTYRKELTCYGSSAASQTNYQKLIRVYKTNVGVDTAENIAQYTTGSDNNAALYTSTWEGQTFTAETTGTVKKVWLKLVRTGTPNASYTCAIRATTAGVPSGANMCSGNIMANYVSTTADWYEFDMGAGTPLTSGTVYAVILYSTGGSAGNLLSWSLDATSPAYTGGQRASSTDSGATWSADATRDFQFQVLTSTTGTTPLRVDCEGYCQDDFDDLRFTKSDGCTLLDYWIESYVSGSYADVWVELDSIAQMTGTDEHSHFYMYYGNTSATSVSNGANTFLKFEDFEWGADGDSLSTSGGSLTWTVSAAGTSKAEIDTGQKWGGTRSARLYRDGTNNPNFTSTGFGIAANRMVQFRIRKDTSAQLYNAHYSGTKYELYNYSVSEDIFYHNGSFTDSGLDITVNTWELTEQYYNNDATSARLRHNDSLSTILDTPGASATADQMYFTNVLGTSEVWIDNIIMSKVALSRPLWGTPGAEETTPPLWVQDAKVFMSYKETGDWLIAVRYLNTYAPYYDTYDPKQYFVLQLLDGSTIIAQTAMPVWGNKVGNIYLNANQVSALTYGSAYKVRLCGTFTGTPNTDYTLTPADWLGDDPYRLDSWVITSASVIGNYYGTALTTDIAGKGEVLNAAGGTIFSAGINGLAIVRPNIFQIATGAISHTETTTSQSYRETLSDWQTAWGEDGALMLTRIGDVIDVDGGDVGGMIFIIMMLALALLAFPAGHTTAANVLSIPCLGLAIYFGLDIIWLIILALFAAFLLFKNMFMDR